MEENSNDSIRDGEKALNHALNINVLELLRICNAMKVSEVCDKTNISAQHLRDIERGLRNPSHKVLVKLLKVYHVSEKVYQGLIETQKLIKDEEPLKEYQVLLWTTLAKLM